MNSTKTVIMAMIVTFLAIGMTGFAAAGSAMDYEIDFSSVGTGSIYISTVTPVGSDIQSSSWINCDTSGYQDGRYGGSKWTQIDRRTTIAGIQNGDPASGTIITTSQMISPGSVAGGYVSAMVTYYDNAAYGSYVALKQGTTIYDGDMIAGDTGHEYIDVDTTIRGYAYDSGTAFVRGSVVAVTDGSLTAATGISALVSDGSLRMVVDSLIRDEIDDDETSRTDYMVKVRSPNYTADGVVSGFASVNDVPQDTMMVLFKNADVTATNYFYAVTL